MVVIEGNKMVQSLLYLVWSLSSWFTSLRNKLLSFCYLEDVIIGCFHRRAGFDRACDSALISSAYFLFLFSYLSVGVGKEVKQNAS